MGFTRPSLRVPERASACQYVLTRLAKGAGPQGWALPTLKLTPAVAGALHRAFTRAEERYISGRVRLREARREHEAAVARLKHTLRCLIKELSAVLEPQDIGWLSFDLNQPIRSRTRRVKVSASTTDKSESLSSRPFSEGTDSEGQVIRVPDPRVVFANQDGTRTAHPFDNEAADEAVFRANASIAGTLTEGLQSVPIPPPAEPSACSFPEFDRSVAA